MKYKKLHKFKKVHEFVNTFMFSENENKEKTKKIDKIELKTGKETEGKYTEKKAQKTGGTSEGSENQ